MTSRTTATLQAVAYKVPPPDVLRIFDAPRTPSAMPSPDRTRMLLVEAEPYPPIALLARPFLRLAGVRVDPAAHGARWTDRIASMRVLSLDSGSEVRLRLPEDRSCGVPVWSPDGRLLALVRHLDGGKELWLADPASGEAWPLAGLQVNDTLADSYGGDVGGIPEPMLDWTGDGRLLSLAVPTGRTPPLRSAVPVGPRVEEANGKYSQMRTYQDLLAGEEDERLFEYYATSQLVSVDTGTGAIEPLGQPGLIYRFESSPDDRYLLIERLQRPFSYRVPWDCFAHRVEVWDSSGRTVRTVAELPVSDEIPRQGVATGPRDAGWQANRDAVLVWKEALDGGDPTVEVPHRDRLVRLAAPFAGEPAEALRTAHRLVRRLWMPKADHAQITEWDRDRRWRTTWLVDLSDPQGSRRLLFDLSVNDAYGDPGWPVFEPLPSGYRVVLVEDGAIFLNGYGAGEEGARPFLDRFDLATGRAERLFECATDCFEEVICFAGGSRRRIVVQRESPAEPPNLLLADLETGERSPLTAFADPSPELRTAATQLVRYRREDGVRLSGTLHLPPGREPGRRLPLLIWAYPHDYSDAATAGQVRGSDRTFLQLQGASPLWLLLRGWAVLFASLPVVGDPETMNDTFVEQVVASAGAAIDELHRMGIADRRRVVVTGHSYGGFMTVTLLAHSDLFAAGIARSGAYNRTLTPFGFQAERRSYWEVPDVYHRLSPFAYADRVKAPLLLIHGAEDDNSGTHTIQSERLFQAIQGTGGTARLVVLPLEDHRYSARESVLHVLAEMLEWVERHVPLEPEAEGASPAPR